MSHCQETGKVSYKSEGQARVAHKKIGERLRRARRGGSTRRRWEQRPYRCEACGLWHLTSTHP